MRAKKRSGGKKLEVDSLQDAARRGDLEKVRALFKADPDLIYSKDKFGRTPLHWAAIMGRQDMVKFLLSRNRKADVNARASDGETPLYDAVGNGHCHVAELLLANNADINAKTDEGWTPFRLACFRVDWGMVELLGQHGGQK